MYQNHVFISYAHIDNLPLSEEHEGWISRFHATFSVFLSQRLGGEARIWRDQKLQGNDIFGPEIVGQFRESALLISIISPRYVRSEWCRREVVEFCAHALAKEGLVLDNKSRVFKVVKTPVDSYSDLPDVLQDSLGYEFFIREAGQGPLELDPDFGERFKQDYLRKVCILANDAAGLIRCVEQEAPGASEPAAAAAAAAAAATGASAEPTPAAASPAAPTATPGDTAATAPAPAVRKRSVVFLAACGFDQRDNREWLEADLRSHGYRVLPEQRLPSDDEDAHHTALLPLLEQAQLAIHLIGSSYGAVPDGPSQRSLVELQNALAADRSRVAGLKRLIWLPAGLTSKQADQKRFLKALQTDAACQAGADLLQGSLEELRTLMHATLDALEAPPPAPPTNRAVDGAAGAGPLEGDNALVYLICTQQDRKATLPLRKWFKNQGYEISLPAFDGDAAAVRQAHEQLLNQCCAVLIFYGAGDEAWQRSVAVDLRRAPAYRDGRPLPPPITYLAAPDSADKNDMVDLEEPDLVDGRQGFAARQLEPFLQQLSGQAAAP